MMTLFRYGPPTQRSVISPSCRAVATLYLICICILLPTKLSGQVGTIITTAGTGLSGFSGDNGTATSAEINQPFGIALDVAHNAYYIADTGNDRIRRVDGTTHIITTYAGNGIRGYSSASGDSGCPNQGGTEPGDGVVATLACLFSPHGVAVDGSGNLYIGDAGNERIRRVDVNTKIITTYAGGAQHGIAYCGDGMPATQACLNFPTGVAWDTSTGSLYIADSSNNRIRQVDSSGVINTVAGNGTQTCPGDGIAVDGCLNAPTGVAVDSTGQFYIADIGNNVIWKVDTSGNIVPVAGTNGSQGGSCADGSAATGACLNAPSGVAVDNAAGRFYIADKFNARVWVVQNGIINAVAGTGGSEPCPDGVPATQSCVFPTGVAITSTVSPAPTGFVNIYIASQGENKIRGIRLSFASISPQEICSCGNPSEPQIAASQDFQGDPVNTAFGTFSETFQDFSIPGRGLALFMSHTYNSVFAAVTGPLGFGWTHSYNMNLVDNGTSVTITQENGSQVTFTLSGTTYSAPSRVIATLVKNPDGTFLFIRRAQQFFTFSSTGKLLSERDRNAYTTTLTYNSSGQLTTVTDPAGRTLTLTYNGLQLASVTDPISRKVSFAYDGSGNLSTVTDVAGGQTRFTYSANHLLLTMADARSDVVTNTYDASNRVISQTDQLSRNTTFSYATGSTTVTDPKGNVTQDQYNQLNERVVKIRGFGTTSAATWHFAYETATAALNSVTDPDGHISTTTHDASANPLTGTDALGRVTTLTWDAMNDLTSMTDPLGITTTLTYDANGNLLSRSSPLSGTSFVQTYTYQYADGTHPGDVTGVVDPDGKTTKIAYDANGNRISVTDPLGHITKFSYNGIGWMTALTDARGKTTTSSRNNFGDPTVTTDPLGHKVSRGYDLNRNLTSLTDANGNLTSFTYDAANEQTTTTRANGTTLRTVYNADGTVSQTIDGASNATTYSYDSLARMVSISDPLGRTTRYGYDGVGNQLTLTDPASQVTARSYDAVNELTGISYSDGKTPNVAFAYDAAGQRTSMTDGTGTSSWTYDSLHRVKSTTNGAGATVSYTYDLKGQLIKLTYPGGTRTVSRSYDAAGRLTSITDWLGNKTIFAYDQDGNLTTETLPTTTGIAAKASYDAASRLTGIVDAKGTTTLASFGYTRDGADLLTKATETGVPSPGTDAYGYTKLNQLANVNLTAYSYDAADNVTGIITPSQFQLKYDTANELTSLILGTQTTTFSYDTRGNRLSRTPPSGPALSYAYDQANRIVAFGSSASYHYDGDGLRMSKTVSGKAEAFTWQRAGTLPLLLVDDATSYVYGPDGLPLEQVSSSGTALFYLHDQLGSTRLLVTGAGAVQAGYTYDAYGNVLAKTGTAANPFGYAGEFLDTESGLIYLRARYYDPATAQFLARDPFTTATLRPYGYGNQDPVNESDPLGLDPVLGNPSAMKYQLELMAYENEQGVGQRSQEAAADTILNIASVPIVEAIPIGEALSSLAGLVPGAIRGVLEELNLFGQNLWRASVPTSAGADIDNLLGCSDNLSNKIVRQMVTRGWTKQEILDTVKAGKAFPVINKATGGAATEYVSASGKFVVVDNATKQVIQVSGPGFLPNHMAP
jgi:RHS repeat-associated protein